MTKQYHLSFSIGPVQTFVAQARRTRDLWAGSWLLSFLAESALAAAENAGGKTLIPHRTSEQRGRVSAEQSPIGGMPNRFEIVFDGDHAKQDAVDAAKTATEAFKKVWQKVAQAVYDNFLNDHNLLQLGHATPDIWTRQMNNFWELSWVVGQPDGDDQTIGRLVAHRKNFRNVNALPEPGTKCSLMPNMQELSGHFGSRAGESQKTFWHQVRKKLGGLDLGESERLCAIALIKRLFPRVIKEAIGEDVSDSLNQVGWPSTAFIAATPWLKDMSGDALQAARRYQEKVLRAGYEKSEWQAARHTGIDWAVADGPIWFASAVRNDEPGREKLEERPKDDSQRERDATVGELLAELKSVYRAAAGETGASGEKRPVPYYALLLMDGDSMGQLLGELRSNGGPQTLSQCLGKFADCVGNIVFAHGGRTVYAGGDDVLALLPASSALVAADKLRTSYHKVFRGEDITGDVATISAAVVYAHWRYPLRQVLRLAHHLLDHVAKDTTGRDSVALGIVLGSGLNAVWSVPWNVFHGTARTVTNDPCHSLLDMLDRFESREVEDSSDPPFNASFLYLLRERFAYLLGDGNQQPGEFLKLSGFDSSGDSETTSLLRDLAHAEYRRRMKKDARADRAEADTQPIADQLMSLSRQWKRHVTGSGAGRKVAITCNPNTFGFDGWRVARFLKQIKDGKVDDHD